MKLSLLVLLAAVGLGGCSGKAAAPIEIEVHYSRFLPAEVTVRAGVPVAFVFTNEDPIDHEWIVGDDEVHAHHRTGTDPLHGDIPTEIFLPALETRTTVVSFDGPGRYHFICHLPGHEAYGMTGVVTIVP